MKSIACLTLVIAVVTLGCADQAAVSADSSGQQPDDNTKVAKKPAGAAKKMPDLETITLGAGCFWCIEAVLARIDGVESVVSGYTGGKTKNPTYEDICTGLTGHAEVVKVDFDPKKLKLDVLLEAFWLLHDPTTLNRQGADVGTQYRSAIFYHNDTQKEIAEKSKKKWDESGKFASKIVTEITAASKFYIAEKKHQDFFARNPTNRYCAYNIPPKLKKLGLDMKKPTAKE